MKKLLLTASLLILGASISFAQLYQGEFAVGGTNIEECYAMVQSADGGYVFTGYTQSYADPVNGAMYVCKLDYAGNLAWTRTIDGKYGTVGFAITQLNDKGFAVVGSTTSFGDTAAEDVYIVKLDSMGNFKWSRTIGGPNTDRGDAVIQDKAGDIVIGGYTSSFGPGQSNFYLIKLDISGNLKWAKAIGGSIFDAAYALAQTTDGGYVLTGFTTSYGDTVYGDIYVVKVDSAGNFKWGRSVGGGSYEVGSGIAATKDGGCIATGYTNSYGAGASDVYIIKLDSVGNVKWTKVIGGKNDDYGNSIVQTADGGYAVSGLTSSYNDTINSDAYLVKLDAGGNVKWTKTYGGNNSDESNSLVQTYDWGYALAGETNSFGAGNFDMYLVKTDSNGGSCSSHSAGGAVTSGGMVDSGGVVVNGGAITSVDSGRVSNGGVYTNVCSVITSVNDITPEENGIEVYPNPSNGVFIFQANSQWLLANSKVEVYNVLGEKVYAQSFNIQNSEFKIDLIGQPNGIYIYKVVDKSGTIIARGKLVVE